MDLGLAYIGLGNVERRMLSISWTNMSGGEKVITRDLVTSRSPHRQMLEDKFDLGHEPASKNRRVRMEGSKVLS